jgi:aspartate 1-decarboxylase
MRFYLRSKIHRATVTDAALDYIGSITIDADLLDRTGLETGERVLVVDNTNGARLETYIIRGDRGSGTVCINGAAAHLIKTGDEIIVMGFELSEHPVEARAILVDSQNRYVEALPRAEIHPVASW